jgi:hypothetical protein
MWALLDRLSHINNFTSYSDSSEAKKVKKNSDKFFVLNFKVKTISSYYQHV